MVSFDFEHEFDQSFSFDDIDFESSSDHESLCDELISPVSTNAEVLAPENEEDHLTTSGLDMSDSSEDELVAQQDCDQEDIKISSNTPELVSTSSTSDAEEVDTVSTTLIGAADVKSELMSPILLALPYRGHRGPIQPYPETENDSDDDDSRGSSYTPPSPSPRKKATPIKKSPKRSSKFSPGSSSSSKSRSSKSPVRGGEPRRQQNMVAQKKYRDKKVQSAHVMLTNWLKLLDIIPLIPGPAKSAQRTLAQVIELAGHLIEEVNNVDENMASRMDLARQGGQEE